MSTLPLGLVRYKGDMFERLHQCGSKHISASLLPGVFGSSPFFGAYAVAAHVMGKAALRANDNVRTIIGKRLEPVAIDMLVEETGQRVQRVHAYARHRRLHRFVASPDGILWDPADKDGRRDDPGNVEIKVVHELVFAETWQDGPPMHVQIQHQAQYACTGAMWGCIAALIWGMGRFDLIVYPTTPVAAAIAVIEERAEAFLAAVDREELPKPDTHDASIDAMHRLYPELRHGSYMELTGRDLQQAIRDFDHWVRLRKLKSRIDEREQELKKRFDAMALDVEAIRLGPDRTVKLKTIKRRGYQVQPSTYRNITPRLNDQGA